MCNRKCKHCGKELTSFHGNREFCIPPIIFDKKYQIRDCKITYNNLKAKFKRDRTKIVAEQQYKNWNGFNNLFYKNKIIVTEAEMRSEGIYCESFIISKIIVGTGEEVK